MCRFLESIRVEDGKAFLTDLHQKRMDHTFFSFKHVNPLKISEIFNEAKHTAPGLFKWRLRYNLQGGYSSEFEPYIRKKIENFELIICDTLDYSFKFEDRSVINELKEKSSAAEIIIVQNGNLTDNSFSNLIFLKAGKWYTPQHFLLNGTMRQHLLKENRILETEITTENLSEFSHFQVINAMNGMYEGFVYSVRDIIGLNF